MSIATRHGNHYSSKLQADPAKVIKRKREGFTTMEIAEYFGCTTSHIRKILRVAAANAPPAAAAA